MAIQDLWPADISDETDLVMPVTILREQAAALAKRTKGVLEAEVRSTNPEPGQSTFVHEFVIVAPTLDSYALALFYVTHDVAGYPLAFVFHEMANKVENQEALVSTLKIVFNHEKTKAIIQALLAQSKS